MTEQTSTITIVPDVEEIQIAAVVQCNHSKEIAQVTNSDERTIALRELDDLTTNRKNRWEQVESWYKQMRKYAAKAAEVKKAIVDTPKAEEKRLRRLVDNYDREQARIAEKLAREQADALRKAQEDARIAQAEQLSKEGFQEAADMVLDAPLPTPVVMPEIQRRKGARKEPSYEAEVVDFMALVRGVSSGKLPASYLLPNQPVLNSQARALKTEFRCDGVRVRTK